MSLTVDHHHHQSRKREENKLASVTLCQNSVLCYTQSSIRTWQPKDVCSLFHLLPADGELTSKKVVRLMALCRLLIFPLCAPGVKKKSTSRKHTRRDNKDHSLHTSSCSFQDNPWTDPLIFPFSSSTPYCCLSLALTLSLLSETALGHEITGGRTETLHRLSAAPLLFSLLDDIQSFSFSYFKTAREKTE